MRLPRFARDSKQVGVVALISVIVIGSIALTVAMSVLLISLDSAKASSISEFSAQARKNADTCAERALNTLRSNAAYVGNESLALTSGTCDVLAVTGAGGSRRVQARGTVSNSVSKVEVQTTQLDPQVLLQSWQEVADFSP